MTQDLTELWSYRELLLTMVRRELRIRYKNSFFGFFWSFVQPAVITVVMWLLFNGIFDGGIKSYSAYYLAAYLPFNFFQQSILDSAQSVLAAQAIIKKIYFPRELLPLTHVISNFIHLLLGLVVFFVYLLIVYIFHPGDFPLQVGVIYLPFLLLVSFVLALGLGLLVSALNTFYEDVKYLVGVGMYLMYFLCPIMYFIEMVANSRLNRPPFLLYKLYNLNPFATLCVAYRKLLLAPVQVPAKSGGRFPAVALDWNYLWICTFLSFVALFIGYTTFNRLKWKFVERP